MQLLRHSFSTFCNFCATFLKKIATFALLALKGRQSTDGGERSVTPGHVPLPPPAPSLAPSAQGGGVINLPCPGATRCLPPSVICRPVGARGSPSGCYWLLVFPAVSPWAHLAGCLLSRGTVEVRFLGYVGKR